MNTNWVLQQKPKSKKMEATQEKNTTQPKLREAGMECITGAQGVGKTYLNMHIIRDYVRDKIANRVRGRKCLIFDTNGEFTTEQFTENNIPNFEAKRIAVKDIPAWCKTDVTECRRIDAKNLSAKEKKIIIEFIIKTYRNGMLVLEDINTYILNVTHMENIVSGLVNLRHRGVDILISYQSLRPVEPRIWQNSRWIRMHYQADSVNDIKGKVNNPTLFRIAQLIVNTRYFAGDERVFVYIYNLKQRIDGDFTLEEFTKACHLYLRANKKYIKEYKEMYGCSDEEALQGQTNLYIKQYYKGV